MPDPEPANAVAAKTENAVPVPFALAKETIWRKLANWFWGYDYFISYHWASGGAYAVALAQRLRDRNFEVFLDRAEFAMGDDWKGVGERAIRNTQRLVLIATREAVTVSLPVEHEISLFTSRGKQVVPIVFTGDPARSGRHSIDGLDRSQHRAVALIADSQLYIQDDYANLSRSPSDGVIKQLTDTHRIMRRRNVRALAMGLVATVLIAFSTFSTASWIRAYFAQVAAEEARLQEEEERKRAEERARIATSRQLAAEATTALGQQFDLAFPLAVEALRSHDTFEARRVLVRALVARPGLSTYLHPTDGLVPSTVFSPDGKTLAVGVYPDDSQRGPGRVDFWDLATSPARIVHSFQVPTRKVGGQLRALALRADGTILAVGCSQSVILYDTAQRRQVMEGPFGVAAGHLESLAFSPDGTILVAGTQEPGSLVFWDVVTRRQLAEVRFDETEGHVTALAFHPDGKTLAIGLVDSSGPKLKGRIVLFDVMTRGRSSDQPLEMPEGPAYALEYAPDGSVLAAGYMSDGHPQGGVVFWDPAARRRSNPPVAVPGGVAENLAFGPEGATLIVAYRSLFGESGGLLAYDVRGRRRLTEPPIAISEGSIVHLAISRDRRTLAVGYIGTRNRRESGVTIWDVTKLRDRAHLSLELAGGFNGKSAISPDGRTAAFERYPLVLWDLAAKPGPTRAALRPPGNWVEGLAFSPDGRTLASGYLVDFQQPRGGGVVLWDVATRRRRAEKPLLVPEAGQDSCVVTFSPDGATLVAGFETAGVILWDVASGVRRTKKPIALSGVGALAFSPDGTTLAIGLRGFTPEAKNEVVLWDLTLGRPSERQPLAGLGRYVLCVRFSPDGTTLVAGFLGGKGAASGFAWGDLGAGGRPGAVIQPVRDGVYSLAFSPDGSILATGSSQYSGSSVQLWDVAARRQLLDQAIPIAGSLVSDVTFCAEGRLLAVCSYDKPSNRSRWTFWDVVPAAERARRAGEIANRNLSADEWSRSFPDYPYRPTFENLPGVKSVETSAGPGSSALR